MIAPALAAVCAFAGACHTATQPYAFRPVVSGLARPTYVTTAPGAPGTLYVVEQAGRIETVEGGRITGTFLDITSKVDLENERGLLSMAFSPRYQKNHLFYVYYTDLDGTIRIVEYRSDGTAAIPSTARQLLEIEHPDQMQNGGQLQFDRQGLLYAGTGGADQKQTKDPAQNLSMLLGKILRIDPLKLRARWQILGFGLRNVWRFSFDRATGDLWLADVGGSDREEIDFRPRAKIGKLANYGWHRYEGTFLVDRTKPLIHVGELVWPTWEYGHTNGACSVTGGYVYRGSAVPAAVGRYFFGDFCNGKVWSFKVAGGRGRASAPRQEPFTIPDLTSFGEDGAGELYATSLGGTLYKLGG